MPGTSLALLWSTLNKIGFPGWPDPNLDSVSGFGASIIKRGLAPAPFLLFPGSFLSPPATINHPVTGFVKLLPRPRAQPLGAKKMSGRWGDRPLGRGDGGKRNPKLAHFFQSLCCAREQQYGTQEQFQPPRKPRPTPDYNCNIAPQLCTGR